MGLADMGVGTKVSAVAPTKVALLVTPRERNFTIHMNLVMPNSNIQVYSYAQTPPLAKLAQTFDMIVTSRQDVLDLLADKTGETPSVYTYQGSVFNYRRAKVLIIDNIRASAHDAAYCLRTQQYCRKLTHPFTFPKQSKELRWESISESATSSATERLLAKADASIAMALDIETIPHAHGETSIITMVGFTFIAKDLSTFTSVIPVHSRAQHELVRKICAHKAPKIMHGGRYDCTVLLKWGLPPANYLFDTMTMFHSWLHDLPKKLSDVTAFCVKDSCYWKEGRKAVSQYDKMLYNARDCEYTALSFIFMTANCPEWTNAPNVYKARRNHYAIKYGYRGMTTDANLKVKALQQAEPQRDAKLERLRAVLGEPNFNPASPKQSLRLLQILAQGRTGVVKADKKSLDKIQELDGFCLLVVTLIKEIREANKLIGTYLNARLTPSGRLLYGLNVLGTTSDRWASNAADLWDEPEVGASGKLLKKSKNLGQAVMVFTRTKSKDYWLPSARSYIVADKGFRLGSCDLPQSESRFTAYISGDENLIAAVESDADFHKTNASAFFGIVYEAITDTLRQLAKPVNHGATYNMGEWILIETMGLKNILKAQTALSLPAHWSPFLVAKHLLDAFKEAYPYIKGSKTVPLEDSWYGSLMAEVAATGKITTPWGWTSMILGDPSKHKPTLNTLVSKKPQNMSAEYLHRGMDVLEALHGNSKDFEILAPIHDEILFQCRVGTEKYYGDEVQKALTQSYTINGRAFTITPDLPCFGDNWSVIH